MQNMSFFHTADQILDGSKTVTRRRGWWKLKPGQRLQAVRQAQGLKKGEKVKKLRVIEVVSTRREALCNITQEDVIREGFTGSTVWEFICFFAAMARCHWAMPVNRIEFRYVDEEEALCIS